MSVRLASLLIATALLAACGKADPDLAALQALERGTPAVSFARPVSVRVEVSTQAQGLDLKAMEKALVAQGFSVDQTVTESSDEPKYQAKLVATGKGAFKVEDLAALLGTLRKLAAPPATFEWTVAQAS